MKIRLKVSRGQQAPYSFEHSGPIITIGRAPDVELSIPDDKVSWNHARIELNDCGAVIRDLQSSNGTYVNGVKIDRLTTLKLNHVIRLGKTGPQIQVRRLHQVEKPPPVVSRPPVATVVDQAEPPSVVLGVPVAMLAQPTPAAIAVPPSPQPTKRKTTYGRMILALLFLVAIPGLVWLFLQQGNDTSPTEVNQVKKEHSPDVPTAQVKLSGEEIYVRLMKSCVFLIQTDRTNGKVNYSLGSGSLIGRNPNLILTNYHVVRNETHMQVFFSSYNGKGELIAEKDYYLNAAVQEKGVNGKVIAKDQRRDLALLQLPDSLPKNFRVLPISTRPVRSGQVVHSVGNPGASFASWVYTSGSVRQVGHTKRQSTGPGLSFLLDAKVIETQSPTNPGDSGGPLVNDYCELVGVTQGYDPGARSVSIFVHMEEVRSFLHSAGYTWTDGDR